MHIAFVTLRYGQAIVGGAEAAVRSYATRIALKGHKVEVITSTSTTLSGTIQSQPLPRWRMV